MERWTGLPQVPAGYGPSVVTMGNFDGVHLGHQAVLHRVVTAARQRGAHAVAVTFEPHPLRIHRPEACPETITPTPYKLDLLEDCGLDAALVLPYDLEFSRLSPHDFVLTYLSKPLGMCEFVAGADLRFGRANSGDVGTLRDLGRELGFTVEVLGDVGHDAAGGGRWSSTWVRALLDAGDVDQAAVVLGRLHRVSGTVVRGDQRGRKLGFPTANLGNPVQGMIPADGVYAGWLTVLDGDEPGRMPAAISIGTNPTFDAVGRRVEAHVLGRDDLQLYGKQVAVDFVARLRYTLRFESADALITQMHDDVSATARLLTGVPHP